MILNQMMPVLGPVVLIINITTMFLCMRPKRGIFFTIGMLAVFSAAIQFLTMFLMEVNPSLVRFCGILYVPLILWLFKGQTFQKVFAFFIPYQLGALPTHLADAFTGITAGYDSPYALVLYVSLSLTLLGGYFTLVMIFGRRLLDRMFVDSRRGDWVLYSMGAIFSFLLILSLDWTKVGSLLYFYLILFILWSVGVLCYTIINTHEKTAQVHHSETLLLQMQAMREQVNAEKEHRNEMAILHHDMRHAVGTMMELFRKGNAAEAENIYADWQCSLTETAPEFFCAEPVLNAVFSRFARKAKDQNIRLHINSNISDTLPVDTIGLSAMVSNALENALTATDRISGQDERVIRIKMIQNDVQVGLEVINPCAGSVEFDNKGVPITHKAGHGIGMRSIVAFAESNGYLLDFRYDQKKFAMRLVMRVTG